MDSSGGNRFSELTADIVSAYVSNNNLRHDELPDLIAGVHTALQRVQGGAPAPAESAPQEPAVSIRKSVTPDYIVCLEDGKKFKSLKRHLNNEHGMTPDEYRAKWSLKKDYSIVAANYSASRSSLARAMGLGRKAGSGGAQKVEPEPTTPAPAKRRRRAKEPA